MSHFAVLDIWWSYTCADWLLHVQTSALVHLWTYYTDIEPRRHPRTRLVRGLLVPWDTYFCFVAWKALEQDEPGDTFIHTFTWLDWPVCLIRWFTQRGKVAGEWSPSAGPLFRKHRHDVLEFLLLTEPWSHISLPPIPPPDMCHLYTERWSSL